MSRDDYRASGNRRGRRTEKRRPPRTASAPGEHYLYGLHTVAAALANPVRQHHRLLVTANAARRLQLADKALTLAVEEVDVRALDRLVGGDAVHQGCVLFCDPLPEPDIGALSESRRLLGLDQVTDPHNGGAILRNAAAFAVDALIVTSRHSPQETAVLAKSAAGALDLVPIARVRNLSQTIEDLRLAGHLTVGLAGDAEYALDGLALREPFALVLGAEGKGLRQKTRDTCEALGRIDMPGEIASLNVSNAAAVALYISDRAVRGQAGANRSG